MNVKRENFKLLTLKTKGGSPCGISMKQKDHLRRRNLKGQKIQNTGEE
jgi:hypothetical protein